MRIERNNHVAVTRRGFLKSAGGLVLGFVVPLPGRAAVAAPTPAFANAIFRLTGKRLRKLPFDLG